MHHGELDRVDDRWRLRFVRLIDHAPDKVWRAITEPEHLATWYPTTIEGDRAAGASLRFAFIDHDGPATNGRMTVYEPPSVWSSWPAGRGSGSSSNRPTAGLA